MRTATSRQLAGAQARDRKIAWRVYINDAGGSPVDWTAQVREWECGEDQEEFMMGATVSLFRSPQGGTSASPFVGSPAGVYPGRSIEIQVAVVAQGDSIIAEDWFVLFRGTIDDAGWGGDDEVVTVPARGKGRNLMKAYVRSLVEYGNPEGTVPAQDVMQAILDAVFGAGTLELFVEDDPDFGVILYEQKRESVRDALQAIVDLFGFVFRYKWSDAYEDWVLTLFEPDRAQTVPDWTFGPGDYTSIETLELSTVDIRNEVEILYDDELDSVVVIDSDSIAEFGGEDGQADYFFLDVSSDPQLNSLTKVTALAVAILSDLSQPRAIQVTANAFWPFAELEDFYRWSPAEGLYDTAQDMAVTAFRHVGNKEEVQTYLTVRGRPSGGASRWFYRKQKRDREKEIEDIAGLDPEGLVTAETEFRYTNRYASQGNSVTSSEPESLGVWVSQTRVPVALGNVFRDVDDTERVYGKVFYKAVAFCNFNADAVPQPLVCPVVFLNAQESDGVHYDIALDPIGVVEIDSPYPQAIETGHEEDEPVTSPSLVWVRPDAFDHPDILEPADVPAGSCFVIWIRLTVDPGAEGQITDDILTVANRVLPAA